MEAGLNDLTRRIERIEHQMREIMQGIVYLYESMAMEHSSQQSR
jgi:uncharacterized protein (UPF0335 family)